MIDLHCHILPGLDDGPVNFDFSVAMARAAAEAGIQVMVATPHIRSDYDVDPAGIEGHVRTLNEAIADEGIQLLVLSGGEVSLLKAAELDDDVLRLVCLGSSDYVLLESPYRASDVDIEGIVRDVQERGFRPLLAHPERCPIFQHDPDRLQRLVNSGVLCSITAASLAGGFGSTVKRFTLDLVADGLVHDVASDAHDHLHRPPDLLAGFDAAESDFPGIGEQASWFTVTSPVAILAGRSLPPRPDPPPRPPTSRWRRLVSRG
ncbi:MAG: tyrosine protein phosphatase [Actinomycetota bacterium]|nr:tyrosine protein phosphatase [Actinomycetota bacterium]